MTVNSKSQYKTKQRAELLGYLASRPGEHVTAKDICQHFEEKGHHIGVTTVYRQMERMVEEGLVNKYILDGTTSACYEYISGDEHEHGAKQCYHCKCEKCGKLIHMYCEEIEMLFKHIQDEHEFVIDPRRTVLYGLCDSCRSASPA